jgi:hypothetical protein
MFVFAFSLTVYHSRGGPMVVSEAMVMELPDIIKHAAQELEENIVDVNGVDQIGNLIIYIVKWKTRYMYIRYFIK